MNIIGGIVDLNIWEDDKRNFPCNIGSSIITFLILIRILALLFNSHTRFSRNQILPT